MRVSKKQSTSNFPKNEHFLLPDMQDYWNLKNRVFYFPGTERVSWGGGGGAGVD